MEPYNPYQLYQMKWTTEACYQMKGTTEACLEPCLAGSLEPSLADWSKSWSFQCVQLFWVDPGFQVPRHVSENQAIGPLGVWGDTRGMYRYRVHNPWVVYPGTRLTPLLMLRLSWGAHEGHLDWFNPEGLLSDTLGIRGPSPYLYYINSLNRKLRVIWGL